jgi:hypothetical protein
MDQMMRFGEMPHGGSPYGQSPSMEFEQEAGRGGRTQMHHASSSHSRSGTRTGTHSGGHSGSSAHQAFGQQGRSRTMSHAGQAGQHRGAAARGGGNLQKSLALSAHGAQLGLAALAGQRHAKGAASTMQGGRKSMQAQGGSNRILSRQTQSAHSGLHGGASQGGAKKTQGGFGHGGAKGTPGGFGQGGAKGAQGGFGQRGANRSQGLMGASAANRSLGLKSSGFPPPSWLGQSGAGQGAGKWPPGSGGTYPGSGGASAGQGGYRHGHGHHHRGGWPGFDGGFASWQGGGSGFGSRGSEDVRWAQDCLNQVMSTNLPVDGVMQASVRSLIRSFQQSQGLRPSGILGPDTREALQQACNSAGDGSPDGSGGGADGGNAGDGSSGGDGGDSGDSGDSGNGGDGGSGGNGGDGGDGGELEMEFQPQAFGLTAPRAAMHAFTCRCPQCTSGGRSNFPQPMSVAAPGVGPFETGPFETGEFEGEAYEQGAYGQENHDAGGAARSAQSSNRALPLSGRWVRHGRVIVVLGA